MKQEDAQQKWKAKFFGKIFSSIIIVPLVLWLAPSFVPFRLFEFWGVHGTPKDWILTTWPIFAWSVGLTALVSFSTRNKSSVNRYAERIIKEGTKTSIIAGVVEEFFFRWLFFLEAIIILKVANIFFFGFLGLGVPEWLHMHALGPVANFFTFHALEPYLFHESGWAVGAAMLASNSFFRDGHKYLGPFGWVNSWCIGMFLFRIMFTFGLPVAIAAHFLYDFLIFAVRYLDAAIERARGNA